MRPTLEAVRYAIKAYIQPARERGEVTVRIRVGWTSRTASVFSTLKSQPFQQEAGVELIEKRGGPPSGGPSTTVEFVYRVLSTSNAAHEQQKCPPDGESLMSLYGICAEAFKQLGGEEAYLKREREELRFPTEDYPFMGRKK